MKNIIILVDESYKNNMKDLIQELNTKGFILNKKISDVHLLAGKASSSVLSDLSRIPNIIVIEKKRNIYEF